MSLIADIQKTVEILEVGGTTDEIVMSIADAKDLLAQLAARDAEIVELRKDAGRLDYMIANPDAMICNAGNYGPYFICKRYAGISLDEAKTPRLAIDAAIARQGDK